MKSILSIYFSLAISSICISQVVTPEVIISASGEFENGGVQVIWTLGDFQTTTFSKSDLSLTQGFLQSNFTITGILNMTESTDIKIKVFPNPVRDILNIQVKSNNNSNIQWELINQAGKTIKTGDNSSNLNNSKIDFSSYNNGVYFIRTFKKDGSYMKVFKVVYLN